MIVAEGLTYVLAPDAPTCASMGPQLDSCGRTASSWPKQNSSVLQWGRNLIVAEGRTRRPAGRAVLASMGPQLDSCGREGGQDVRTLVGMLQWGRNLIVAEGYIHRTESTLPAALQWGRNLIVAEGTELPRPQEKSQASMGPQLDSCGRRGVGAPGRSAEAWLQWGRNLIVAEGRGCPRRARSGVRFNGAAT